MLATIHVVALYRARAGKEAALKSLLTGLIAPTRRELWCRQYDLLENPEDPGDLCFVERWEGDKALEQHLQADHVKAVMAKIDELAEGPPQIRRYRLV